MDYVIEKMGVMKVIGYERSFLYQTAYQEIPKFWNEFCNNCMNGKNNEQVQKAIEECMIGEFGICIEDNSMEKEFLYMIAGTYNGSSVPDEMKIFEIPALEWAKFKCTGPMPGAL